MRTLFLPLALLSGCGTVPLGVVHSHGQAVSQRDADIAECKEYARQQTDTDERIAASIAAGLTIVGAPAAIASARAKQRESFAECMTARGYEVTPPKS